MNVLYEQNKCNKIMLELIDKCICREFKKKILSIEDVHREVKNAQLVNQSSVEFLEKINQDDYDANKSVI